MEGNKIILRSDFVDGAARPLVTLWGLNKGPVPVYLDGVPFKEVTASDPSDAIIAFVKEVPQSQHALLVLDRLTAKKATNKSKTGKPKSGRSDTGFSLRSMIPARNYLKLQFSQGISGAAAVAVYTSWRVSLYDPDPAIGGPSIMGFTEIMAFYKNFLVRRWRVRITPFMFTSSTMLYCVSWPSRFAALGTETFQQSTGQPEARFAIGCNDLAAPTGTTTIESPWYDAADVAGVMHSTMTNDENWWGDVGHDSTSLCFQPIVCYSSTGAATFGYIAQFEYEAEFFNRIELTV
jgi:hypothetical protein